MERLRVLGHAAGEYAGDGQGELEDPNTNAATLDTEPQLDDQSEESSVQDSTYNAHPLLFFFDCETTGFSIYDDHIIESAAKVIGVPLASVSMPSFASLVHTPRNIPAKGKIMSIQYRLFTRMPLLFLVTEKTGINAACLRGQPPLSIVLP